MLEKILKKIIVKTRVNRVLFSIFKKIIKPETVDVDMNKAKIIEQLESVSPYPNGQCFYNKNSRTNDKYDLTIIIPSYNMGEYLEECIDSVVKQKTKYNVLTIVVNDGSTDNTKEVLEKYINNKYVKIIQQENKGFSQSRNVALDLVESKYIMFLDSDDRLLPKSVDSLLDCAFRNDADVVEGNHYDFLKYNFVKTNKSKFSCEKVEALGIMGGYPWAKVFKASIFANLRYPENFWYEDTIMAYLVFPRCYNAYTIDEFVYAHLVNFKGITLSSNKYKKSVDSYWIVKRVFEDLHKFDIELNQKLYEQTLEQLYRNFERCKNLDVVIQKSIFILFIKLIEEEFKGKYILTIEKYKELERSIKQRDFAMYKLVCKMM